MRVHICGQSEIKESIESQEEGQQSCEDKANFLRKKKKDLKLIKCDWLMLSVSSDKITTQFQSRMNIFETNNHIHLNTSAVKKRILTISISMASTSAGVSFCIIFIFCFTNSKINIYAFEYIFIVWISKCRGPEVLCVPTKFICSLFGYV